MSRLSEFEFVLKVKTRLDDGVSDYRFLTDIDWTKLLSSEIFFHR